MFAFTISLNEDYVVVGGDHKYKGDDKKRRREAFLALHRFNTNLDHVQTMSFPNLEKHFINITRDPLSGVIIACEYGTDIYVFRYLLFKKGY